MEVLLHGCTYYFSKLRTYSQISVHYKKRPCPHSKFQHLQLLSTTGSLSGPQHIHKLKWAKLSLSLSPSTQNTVCRAQTSPPSPQCRRQTSFAQPPKILFFRSWPLWERKQNSQSTTQPEMKFRKSFCSTGARQLGVPNLSLHSPVKPHSITHFLTLNHDMA